MAIAERERRTLKRVVDLETMQTISSDDLLTMHADDYQVLRRSATRAKLKGTTRYVCECCGHAVYAPRAPSTGRPMWRHHRGAPANCPWWTGNTNTPNSVSAAQFDGIQESPLHARLKNLLGALLAADPRTQPGSVVIDKYLITEDGRRRPDVMATYMGTKTVFEVQLSTTQIPIILGREDFYENEGMRLVWLTWNFEPPPSAGRLKSSFEDIYYSHGKCLFSLDEATVRQSEASGALTVRSFRNEKGWTSELVQLAALSWLPNGRASVLPTTMPWHESFVGRWRSELSDHGLSYTARMDLFEEIADRLSKYGITVELLEDSDADDLINLLLSLIDGHPVASRQRNLQELLNTFLMAPRRYRLAQLVSAVCERLGRTDLMTATSVRTKMRQALASKQDTRSSIAGRIALTVFPDLFSIPQEMPSQVSR